MKEYNIAISASNSYYPYAKAMMSSFYKMHQNKKINLYVFYADPLIKKRELNFLKFAKKRGEMNEVYFIHVDYDKLKIVDSKKGWAVDLWCRWYLLDYLVDKCDRVLILGIDTMFQANIDEFYFQNLNDYYFSCTSDMYVSNTEANAWPLINADMIKNGLIEKSKYINGDVVLVNLNETKNNLTFFNFLKIFETNQFTCLDQDIITYCFNDKIKYQDYLIYNYFPNLGFSKFNDYILGPRAKIIHFAGGPKPWSVPFCKSKRFYGITQWLEYSNNGFVFNLKLFLCFFINAFDSLKYRLSSYKKTICK